MIDKAVNCIDEQDMFSHGFITICCICRLTYFFVDYSQSAVY